jgi:hypothetical protein
MDISQERSQSNVDDVDEHKMEIIDHRKAVENGVRCYLEHSAFGMQKSSIVCLPCRHSK